MGSGAMELLAHPRPKRFVCPADHLHRHHWIRVPGPHGGAGAVPAAEAGLHEDGSGALTWPVSPCPTRTPAVMVAAIVVPVFLQQQEPIPCTSDAKSVA